MNASIKFTGLNDIIRMFKNAPDFLQRQVADNIRISTKRIKTNAQQKLVPGYGYRTGYLKRSIGYRVDVNKLKASIYAGAPYAAYVEFGTGKGVRVPKELREYAAQFKGRGLRKRDYPAKPFFYPAVYAELPNLKRNLRQSMKLVNKRFIK